MSDVWDFASHAEDVASHVLSQDVALARETGDVKLIDELRAYFDGEQWASIQSKIDVEGSMWVVWWMDAVYRLMYAAACREDRVRHLPRQMD